MMLRLKDFMAALPISIIRSLDILYIQAVDDLFYGDAIIFGKDWYIGPVDNKAILTVKSEGSIIGAKEYGIKECPIKIKVHGAALKSKEQFPPEWLTLADAYSFEISILEPIPVPTISRVKLDRPAATEEMYGFASNFTVAEIFQAVAGGEIDTLLLKALLAKPYFHTDIPQIRSELVRKIYHQHPWIKELKLTQANVLERIKEYSPTIRIKWRQPCGSAL